MQYLKDITALDISEITDAVKAEGHNRMAQVVRMVLIDVFKEAQHAGHVPPDTTLPKQRNSHETR